MMSKAGHLDAICLALEARLDAAPPVVARRLLRPQLRWVAEQLNGASGSDAELAERLGVVELVESCRDQHLASLDADDGLAALHIGWKDVVLRACERGTDRGARRCRRCSEPAWVPTGERCSDCGLLQR